MFYLIVSCFLRRYVRAFILVFFQCSLSLSLSLFHSYEFFEKKNTLIFIYFSNSVFHDKNETTIPIKFCMIGLVVVEAKRTDVNGQCTKKNGDCKGQEIRDSQWNDMKTSMYLLANAFRLNQTKAPDNLPSVRAAKRFFKEMDFVEKAAKKGRKNDKDTVVHYAAALDALDEFLDLVELPPTDSGWYDQIFDRAVSKVRIT